MSRRKLAIQYSISNGSEVLMDERTDEHMTTRQLAGKPPVLRIDNQQNFKIMKILILLKSFISLFYIIRYILRSMM